MTTAAVWFLYRLWAIDGRRMYVGITSQDPPEKRIVQHAQKPWWRYVDSTRTELIVLNRGHPITKGEAETIERREIQSGGGTLANNEWNGSRGVMLTQFLQAGGVFHEWDPDDVAIPTSELPDPWSTRAGQLAVAAGVMLGLIGGLVLLTAAIIARVA